MVLGRFIFGLGGESINITGNMICVKWFQGKELSFANALNLSFIRLATVLNDFITPRIASHKGMNYVFGYGVFLTFISYISLILLNLIDMQEENNEKI